MIRTLLIWLLLPPLSLSVAADQKPLLHFPTLNPAQDALPVLHGQRRSSAQTVRFAILADITGGERDGVLDIAMKQLDLLRPDFVISVGDLIEGSDVADEVRRQWVTFEQRTAHSPAPLVMVGGNHDLLGPAMRATWEERYGPRYFHFLVNDLLFVVLDTDDHSPERLAELARWRRDAYEVAEEHGWDAFDDTPYARAPENNAGHLSEAQVQDVLKTLKQYPQARWTFLFMHKAPWLRADQKGWERIEELLQDRQHMVFHGHEHAYDHQVRGGGEYIRLATTGGVPLPEYGPTMDHLLWVTVEDKDVHIANLMLGGILDRKAAVPGDTQQQCRGQALCADP